MLLKGCKINQKNKEKLLKDAVKAINKKQEETIRKANLIIGDVEKFENEVLKKFKSYTQGRN